MVVAVLNQDVVPGWTAFAVPTGNVNVNQMIPATMIFLDASTKRKDTTVVLAIVQRTAVVAQQKYADGVVAILRVA